MRAVRELNWLNHLRLIQRLHETRVKFGVELENLSPYENRRDEII
jgi:hypothetical protein